ncbi:MAG TPA: HEAT repeat domain-containing protein [Spirochaetota bacterium]|nr:HEAT repeat domain-containing protein [Spirochaetota bacterium]
MGLFKPDIQKFLQEKNFEKLLTYLDHKNPGIRYSAFAALAERADEDAAVSERLKKMVTDSDSWVRTVATLKFAGPGEASVSKSMMEIMNDGSQDDKLELLRVVSGLGLSSDETVLRVILKGLADKKETVKLQAIRAAGKVRSVHLVPNLGDLLHEKHHKIRLYIAESLFHIGGEEATDYLIGLLADKEPEVQAAARSYLEHSSFEYARKAIHDAGFMQLVREMHDREPVRKATAERIGREQIREGLALLHRACRDKYREVRIEALKSIAVFRNPNSVDAAAKLMDDKYHDVRLEAVNTLEKIGGINAAAAVERGLIDKSGEVRKAAEKALEKMNRFP